MILGKYKKQPGETLDYLVSYLDFFANRTDLIATVEVTPESGLTLVSTAINAKSVTIVLSGGSNAVSYKVTIVMTTTSGIVKEDEFYITIKEI